MIKQKQVYSKTVYQCEDCHKPFTVTEGKGIKHFCQNCKQRHRQLSRNRTYLKRKLAKLTC